MDGAPPEDDGRPVVDLGSMSLLQRRVLLVLLPLTAVEYRPVDLPWAVTAFLNISIIVVFVFVMVAAVFVRFCGAVFRLDLHLSLKQDQYGMLEKRFNVLSPA